tara:strand:- start:1821 stop:1964 length:144 start_codon:yes stop_codon:yes gene_type:complete
VWRLSLDPFHVAPFNGRIFGKIWEKAISWVLAPASRASRMVSSLANR